MAKKDKDKHAALPKRIGGVKVPKKLRKRGQSLLKLAHTPVVRELMAGALVAIAGAMAGTDAAQQKGGKAKRKLAGWAGVEDKDFDGTAQAVAAAMTSAVEKWLGGSLQWQRKREESDTPQPHKMRGAH